MDFQDIEMFMDTFTNEDIFISMEWIWDKKMFTFINEDIFVSMEKV